MAELQDLLFHFVTNMLTENQQRKLNCSRDILEKIDEESEDEIKTELYNILLGNVNWSQLIRDIQNQLPEEQESDDEEKDYDDEDEDADSVGE